MQWWNTIIDGNIKVGEELQTPGQGIDSGNRKKPFWIHSINTSKIVIISGKSFIPLENECFNVIEEAFANNRNLMLRCASVRDNEAFENSADLLIRQRTGSNLACANYVCSILEKSNLVKYIIKSNKKWIELP